jgi:hypothetical protein
MGTGLISKENYFCFNVFFLKCDLQTCTQTRTARCIDSMNGRLLTMSECTQNQPQSPLNRICPISACLEWRVAHWNGV